MWGMCLVQPPMSSDLTVAEGEGVGNVSAASAVSTPSDLGLFSTSLDWKQGPSQSIFLPGHPKPKQKENWSIPCINWAF